MRSKILSFLGAFAVAMFLWFYVITTVSPDSNQTFYNIPVIFENESVLIDRELMLVSDQHPTVTVKLNGNRSDLGKLTNSTIMVTVDLSSITEPGHYSRDFRVTVPSGYNSVTVSQRITPSVPVDVVEYGVKEVPVQLMYEGELEPGIIMDQDQANLSSSFVTVSGPKSEVDLIDCAGISINCSGLTETLSDDFVYTLLDANKEPLDVGNVQTDTGSIHVVLPLEHVKEVPLKVTLLEGGGAVEENTQVTLEPATVLLSGSQEALDRISELTITTVDLSQVDSKEGFSDTVELRLPDNLTNRSNVTSVNVRVNLTGLATKTFSLTRDNIKVINVPSGMTANVITLQMDVVVRGPAAVISALTEDKIAVTLDAANQPIGNHSLSPTITVDGGKAGAFGKYTVNFALEVYTPPTEPGTTETNS